MSELKLSSGGVLFARSNALQFVRTDNQAGTEQTIDNRLLTDLVVPNSDDNWNFFQPFKIDDVINTQIATLYTINSFIVYDFLTNAEIETIAVPAPVKSITDETLGAVNYYNFEIDTESYGGYYYVEVTINDTQTYECEGFRVYAFTDNDGVLIKCYNNVISKYNDGIYYDGNLQNSIRVNGRLFTIKPGQVKTVNTGLLGRINVLKGYPLRFKKLELSGVPFWLVEKINIFLQHDHFTINNEAYATDQEFSTEHVKIGEIATYIYTGSIDLQQLDFEKYDDLVAVTPVQTRRIRKAGGGFIKTKTGDKILHK